MVQNRVIPIRDKYAVTDSEETTLTTAGGSSNAGLAPRGTWRRTKIGFTICCALFSLAAIIVGAMLPWIIHGVIQKGVYDTIRLDPSTMTDSTLAKWYNNTLHIDYYLYTPTNLKSALTTGERLNFEAIGPIYLMQNVLTYNVTWDIDNSRVTYKSLTTYYLADENTIDIDQDLVVVNPFWVGAGASTMQGYLQSVQEAAGGGTARTVEFPYGAVSEQYLVGLFMGQVLPTVFAQLTNDTSTLMLKVRGLGVAFYLPFAEAYCAQVGSTYCSWTDAQSSWASATPYMSILTSPDASTYFVGFELDTMLVTTDAATTVVPKLFDSTNDYGLASLTGMTNWAELGTLTDATELATLMGNIMSNTDITSTADIFTIAAWITKLQKSDASSSTVGASYQAAVCAAIAGSLSTSSSSTTSGFYLIYSDAASYKPTTWLEIAALQFGTGAVVGIGLGTSTDFFTTGVGSSVSALSSTYVGLTSPMNFADRASNETLGQAEPFDLVGGVQYAAKYASELSPLTTLHATINANLLYIDADYNTTYRTLTIEQSTKLINVVSSSSSAYLLLTSGVVGLATTYYKTWYTTYASGGYTTSAAAAGVTDANTVIAATIAALPTYIATTCSNDTSGKAAAQLMVAANITSDSWYLVHTFLYSYLGNELSGSLAQLDDDGVAPQNAGMFSKQTMREHLFGYTGRFGTTIPGVAGTYLYSDTVANLLNADYEEKSGRDTIRDTGSADADTVDQFIAWQGVDEFENWCDLDDPGHKDTCGTAALLEEYDWNIYSSEEVIEGHTDGLQMQPFLEGDDNIVDEISIYVSNTLRVLPIVYSNPTEVKGISLRQYYLGSDILKIPDGEDGTEFKNLYKYYQGATNYSYYGYAPNGLLSIQRSSSGQPVLLSLPYWAYADEDFDAGITCTDPADGVNKLCQLIYNQTLHSTHLDIEPMTGLTMNAHKRLQANVRVSALEYFTGTAACPTTGTTCAPVACSLTAASSTSFSPYFGTDFNGLTPSGLTYHYNKLFNSGVGTLFLPYYWADLYDTVTDSDAKKFRDSKKLIDLMRTLGKVLQIVLPIVGAISLGLMGYSAKALYIKK